MNKRVFNALRKIAADIASPAQGPAQVETPFDYYRSEAFLRNTRNDLRDLRNFIINGGKNYRRVVNENPIADSGRRAVVDGVDAVEDVVKDAGRTIAKPFMPLGRAVKNSSLGRWLGL